MTNSMNPNSGHYNPGPVITHPKTPDNRTASQADKPASTGKDGRS